MFADDPARKALSEASVVVWPERFVLAGVDAESLNGREAEAISLLSDDRPFLAFRDAREMTLVFCEDLLDEIERSIKGIRTEAGWRLLTFSTELGLELVGFIALVGKIMAEAGVSILALSSFSRDHILVKEGRVEDALGALAPFVSRIER